MSVRALAISAVRVFAYPEDWVRTRDFYEATLEIPLVFSDAEEGVALFRLGEVSVLIERVARDDDEGRELVGRSVPVSFQIENAGQAAGALQRDGVELLGGPEKPGWGGTLLFLRDPAGNAITLVEHPEPAPVSGN